MHLHLPFPYTNKRAANPAQLHPVYFLCCASPALTAPMIPRVPTALPEVAGTRHRWHRIRNSLLELWIIFITLAPETEDCCAKGSDEKLSLLPNAPDLNPQREIKGKHNRGLGSQQVSSRPRDRSQRSVGLCAARDALKCPHLSCSGRPASKKKQGARIFENRGQTALSSTGRALCKLFILPAP